MKRTIQGVVLAVSLLTGGLSLAQGSSDMAKSGDMGKMQGKSMTKGGMAEYQGFMAPTDEKAFLERLHHINQSEIKAAKLAQQNSQNPDVKNYADMMIKDHTATDQKIMTYAQGKGLKLSDEPKPMNDMEKRAMAAGKSQMELLQSLKGAPFDSSYMADQVSQHDMAIGKVMAAKQGMNATGELATLLTELTTKLPQHRDMAYQVLGKVDDAMGVGGSGTGMNGNMGSGSMQHGNMGGSTGGGMGGNMGGSTGGTTPRK